MREHGRNRYGVIIDPSIADLAWLKDRRSYATENEIEIFLERVAIKVESGIDPNDARRQSYSEQFLS